MTIFLPAYYGTLGKLALDQYVKALLHMNGADGSTTFTDETGRTWTANGSAQIDTAQYKFGGASGYFDGAGDYLDTPDSADFDVGSSDFTVDCWVYRNTDGSRQVICGQVDSTGGNANISFFLEMTASDTLHGAIASGTTLYEATSTGTITADSTWHHVAFVRDGNTLRLFIDGTADGTADVTGVTANDSAYKMAIGRLGEYDGIYWNGWIDEFRFSNGIARWTTNFTPPTSEY